MTPLSTVTESRPTLRMSAVSFSNFSGVSLLRIPRTCAREEEEEEATIK